MTQFGKENGMKSGNNNNSSNNHHHHHSSPSNHHHHHHHNSSSSNNNNFNNSNNNNSNNNFNNNNNTSNNMLSNCAGCGSEILDQYIMKVYPDMSWHASCLKCYECNQFLNESSTCFVRQDKTYCKKDYVRLFATRCRLCQAEFKENDLVMRARNHIYHTDCFRCVACHRILSSGEEYCIREKGIYCKVDVISIDKQEEECLGASAKTNYRSAARNNISNNNNSSNNRSNNSSNTSNSNNNISNDDDDDDDDDGGVPMEEGADKSSNGGLEDLKDSDTCVLTSANNISNINNNNSNNNNNNGKSTTGKGSSRSRSHKSDHKATRVRTVLNEKQLHTLRTCYGANPRPDALMKEQLVEMTGLSPRVIRVWFQNKRCKDKKRTQLLKQIQQQQQEKGENCDIDDAMWLKAKGSTMLAFSPEPPQPWLPPLEHNLFHWKSLMEDEQQQQQLQQQQQQQLQQHQQLLTYQHLMRGGYGLINGDPLCGDDDDDAIVCLKEPHRNIIGPMDFEDDVVNT